MTIIVDGTSGLSDVDGTAAIPAVRGTDTNTGIFFPAADTIAFSEGGVESMRINSVGNVGIGTVSPVSQLHLVSALDSGMTIYKSAVGAGNVRVVTQGGGSALAFGSDQSTGTTERMRIDSSGNVGIGITPTRSRLSALRDSPTGFSDAQVEMLSSAGDVVLSFHAAGASAVIVDHVRGATGIRCVNSTRTAYAPIEASAFTVPSDYRVKENVTQLTGALDRVSQLKPKRFSYIEKSMSYNDGKIVDGFIAHEAALVVPEAVTGEKDAVNEEGKPIMQGIDQAKLIPLLTAAIQELKAEFDAYKAAHP